MLCGCLQYVLFVDSTLHKAKVQPSLHTPCSMRHCSAARFRLHKHAHAHSFSHCKHSASPGTAQLDLGDYTLITTQ